MLNLFKKSEYLEDRRFVLFLGSLIVLIVGNLFFSVNEQRHAVLILVLQNVLFSLILFQNKSIRVKGVVGVFGGIMTVNLLLVLLYPDTLTEQLAHFTHFSYFLFVTIHLFVDIYQMKKLTGEAIFGVFSGFILVALISGFLFILLDEIAPNSFTGIENRSDLASYIYFSFITLMTIGYGDISPVSEIARKLVVFS